MNILLKEIKIFFSFFFLNNVYDRVFFIENKNYLKDFEKFLAHQNSKKKNKFVTQIESIVFPSSSSSSAVSWAFMYLPEAYRYTESGDNDTSYYNAVNLKKWKKAPEERKCAQD